jgi:hypothetical protein
MKRHIIFQKNIGLVNALLETGLCRNEGNWIISCKDSIYEMWKLQEACIKFFKDTPYKNYKLAFVLPHNYADILTF